METPIGDDDDSSLAIFWARMLMAMRPPWARLGRCNRGRLAGCHP